VCAALINSENVLIVDPEPKWVSLVRQILADAGYAVLVANKGERAVQLAAKERLALILLEARLPGEMDGFEVARRIRDFSDVPMIMLSSSAESEDILRGFDVGADDFITKPFDPKILLARLRAILFRYHGREAVLAEIVCDNLVINQASRRVTLDGLEVYLTETEFNLLLVLARHRNQVLLHEQLLVAVWGTDSRTELDNLRSYIHILRRKLESKPSQPRLIISRSGIGYMLVSNQSEVSKK
jgi:two-component system KDP operon response regulator KdpE